MGKCGFAAMKRRRFWSSPKFWKFWKSRNPGCCPTNHQSSLTSLRSIQSTSQVLLSEKSFLCEYDNCGNTNSSTCKGTADWIARKFRSSNAFWISICWNNLGSLSRRIPFYERTTACALRILVRIASTYCGILEMGMDSKRILSSGKSEKQEFRNRLKLSSDLRLQISSKTPDFVTLSNNQE